MASDKRIVGQVNDQLGKFTVNKYEAHVPFSLICSMLEENGFSPSEPEDSPFMLLGHEGKVAVEYVNAEYPDRLFYLNLSWYRMGSGNFETVAGFSSVRSKKRR